MFNDEVLPVQISQANSGIATEKLVYLNYYNAKCQCTEKRLMFTDACVILLSGTEDLINHMLALLIK